jgi:adenosylhomocysteine nucleosidase
VITGMGPEAAARAAAAELSPPVDSVVVAGVAGGCDPDLASGSVVVATALCDLEGRPIESPPPPAEVVARLIPRMRPAVAGTVASAGTIVDDPGERARLAAARAVAVETEAAAWAPACLRAGASLLVVRAILDTPSRPLGAAAGLIPPGGDRPSPRRLLRLLGHPAAWATLPGLARDAAHAETRAATAAVAAALALGGGAPAATEPYPRA